MLIAFLYPNTGEREVFRPGKPQVTHEEPPSTPLPRRDLIAAQRIVSAFVVNAVLREHVERSYDLAAPSVRGGLTRKEWRTGEIPVPPFPPSAVAAAKSKLVYSHPNVARYEVLLYTKPTAQLLPLLYSIEVTRAGRGGRWLVDYAMPLGGGISMRPTPYKPTAAEALADDTGGARLALSWVFVPLALLSLIILVPAVLGVRGWLTKRRVDREYGGRPLPPVRPRTP
jgi:hypothetical protein